MLRTEGRILIGQVFLSTGFLYPGFTIVEVIKSKKRLYLFNSLRKPLILNYKDFFLIYFKTVYRYNETKILCLYNTEFAFINIYLKSNKLKLIKYLFNIYLIL